jgi:hypothetical protein
LIDTNLCSHLLARSPQAEYQIAAELHDRVVRTALAAAPAGHGWTSGFAPPEPAQG